MHGYIQPSNLSSTLFLCRPTPQVCSHLGKLGKFLNVLCILIQCAERRISYEFCRRNDIRHSQFRSTSLVAGDGTCVQCMMALLPKLSCHRSLKTPILLPELLLTSLPKYTQGSPEILGILITLIHEINGHGVSTKEYVCSFISRDVHEHKNYLQVISELHVTEICFSFLYLC